MFVGVASARTLGEVVPEPQQRTSDAVVTQLRDEPASMSTYMDEPAISVGTFFASRFPIPSWPAAFEPQQ
jgi:hypothetical protein